MSISQQITIVFEINIANPAEALVVAQHHAMEYFRDPDPDRYLIGVSSGQPVAHTGNGLASLWEFSVNATYHPPPQETS